MFFAVIGGFYLLWLGATDRIEVGAITGVCGFKQKFGIPCPGCYITRSGEAFVQGHILEAFRVQPAGGVLFSFAALIGGISLIIAVLGIKFRLLDTNTFGRLVSYSVLFLVFVLACGWAVTLARDLANR
ncbi:DUF2752 domain-containing protein [Anaerohalosphaera lusitana]|uniref:DUF2752 domain-containing protein n=1 Tax=Anaerohalosphaera lusitana TaxID=1936003 RepID=UPI0014758B4D|nr:DUF2752 domain-containing protein [Anaerohalosphaera lusitana]